MGYIYIWLCPKQAQFLSPNAWNIRPNSSIHSLPLLYYALHSLIMYVPHDALGSCGSVFRMLINNVMENSEQTLIEIKTWIKPPSVTAIFTTEQALPREHSWALRYSWDLDNPLRIYLGSLEQLKVPARMPNLDTFFTIFSQWTLPTSGLLSFAMTYCQKEIII